MLEGFMNSVKALTEIDTESFIKNSSLQSLLKKEENDPFGSDKSNAAGITNQLTAAEDEKPIENQVSVTGNTSSGSFFRKLGFLLTLVINILISDK